MISSRKFKIWRYFLNASASHLKRCGGPQLARRPLFSHPWARWRLKNFQDWLAKKTQLYDIRCRDTEFQHSSRCCDFSQQQYVAGLEFQNDCRTTWLHPHVQKTSSVDKAKFYSELFEIFLRVLTADLTIGMKYKFTINPPQTGPQRGGQPRNCLHRNFSKSC